MMKNYWILFWTLLFCGLATAQNNEALFSEGMTAFDKKDYETSANIFSQLMQRDSLNATLHYNLGTSYLRLQNTGLSIYHLQKALKFRPDYEQARINLNFAEKLKTTVSKGNLPIPQQQMLYSVFDFLKPNTWAYLALGTMFTGIGLMIFYLFSYKAATKKILFSIGIFAIGISILSYFISKNQSNYLLEHHYVIVTQKETLLMHEPRVISKVLQNITEGSKGLIKEETNQWIRIQLENDTIGWVEKSKVMKY